VKNSGIKKTQKTKRKHGAYIYVCIYMVLILSWTTIRLIQVQGTVVIIILSGTVCVTHFF